MVPYNPPPPSIVHYLEAAWETEGGQGEPRRQHEASEDVARPGAADGLQEAVLPAGPDPGIYGPGGGGGGRGLAGAVRTSPPGLGKGSSAHGGAYRPNTNVDNLVFQNVPLLVDIHKICLL